MRKNNIADERIYVADDSIPGATRQDADNGIPTVNEKQCAMSLNAEKDLKAHIHLGHAESSTLERIFQLAGHKIARDIIDQALTQ